MKRPTFITITTEGGLFPADFLQRLISPSRDVPGLTPESYHLAGHEKLNEAASRAWNRLMGIWAAFQDAAKTIPGTEAASGLTREKWLLPLFNELGYGRLQPAKAIEIEARTYPVSHAWQNVPIHLIGFNVELDRRTAGIVGAARISPHGLVQELLNRRHESLWGFVSNGLKLRLLRDNRSLTRQAYVEFDLAAMMDGQAFSDFVLLWLLCHESRVEGEPPNECWLERWATAAREQGTRALEELRVGVEHAIEALGRGFLKHPSNRPLLDKLGTGTLDRQDYYRQLLRLVYRLIFLFVAESRELLLVAAPTSVAAQRYRSYYSIARLRELAARRRGTPHADLWQALVIVFLGLSSKTGCIELGLPALGSMLWSSAATPDLDACQLRNPDLLEAIRALAFRLDRGMRRIVDWRNLGPEELGSIYESLLELHPEVNTAGALFSLRVAAGHERKETGSYYTPTSLVECLLDSGLDPVLAEAAKAHDPEQAILSLKVCDPAVGSGHFLIAASHRIARRLAAVRTGDVEASPEAVRHALRDVIGHCLYGVDMNPMAVELCKVNLWLEALEPGRPLSFLDHHIQCGNSLLGATPALLRTGIPDAAFEPIEGDDREYCRDLKRWNRTEREGHQNLFTAEPWERLGDLATGLANLDEIDDSSLEGVREKERRYAQIVRSAGYEQGHLLADAWCAAFVWPKTREAHPIGEDLFRMIERNPMAVPEHVRSEIRHFAEEYRFFHWHLAFPDVFRVPPANQPLREGPGWNGGFDAVLGNPPWERIKIQEKEWFAERRPDIATAPNAAARKRLIKGIQQEDAPLWRAWLDALHKSDAEAALVRSTGRYPLCGRGDINTYAIFAELNRSILGPRGRAGFIAPTGIATDDTTKEFFQTLIDSGGLASLLGFENEDRIFPGIHHAFRFCLLTLTGAERREAAPLFAFFLRSVQELEIPERKFTLTAAEIALLNPNTRTCPIFRTRRDAEITIAVYSRMPVLVHESQPKIGNPWGLTLAAMFHMSGASALFRTAAQLESQGGILRGSDFESNGGEFLPLYEAKMIHHFDHRFGTYWGQTEAQAKQNKLPELTDYEHDNPGLVARPEYWIPRDEIESALVQGWDALWMMGWRRITGTEKIRTVIPSVLPFAGVGDSIFLMLPSRAHIKCSLALLANLSSFVLDFICRQKIGGVNLLFFLFRQLPAIPPIQYKESVAWDTTQTALQWITPRVVELVYTAYDLRSWAHDIGWDGPPFHWNPGRRFHLRCELDAAFFHLYRIGREDVDYIMDTFPVVRRNDESQHGEYRTKRLILEIYDRMQHAAETHQPYQTLLDPPPADPSCRHPKKKIGILAFGSLISDPGEELRPKIEMRLKTETPFGVEYGRYSGKTRGGAPTLVPHEAGAPVAAEMLVLNDDVTGTVATNMLWRRERRKTGTGEDYVEGTSENSVLIRSLADNPWVETLLYTDFAPSGKIRTPVAADLAQHAIRSVETAENAKDGITYLIDAIKCGIETPLTHAFRDEILRLTGAPSLDEALKTAAKATLR